MQQEVNIHSDFSRLARWLTGNTIFTDMSLKVINIYLTDLLIFVGTSVGKKNKS